VILLPAILAGLLVGLGCAKWRGCPYQITDLHYLWLVAAGFLPQLLVIYLPGTRASLPDWLVAASLLTSQVLLLAFAWLNRRLPGMSILIIGLVLNLAVMAANGGFMPISPHTAGRLLPASMIQSTPLGSRLGHSKDILLLPGDIHLEWLADRFLLPTRLPYQAAFSLGDTLIAVGAFWLLASRGVPLTIFTNTHKRDLEAR
jgi:hypothetical protein